MTERNLAIRLTVLDGGKVKAELREIGDSGTQSLKKIELAGQPTSRALLAINAAANDVKGGVRAMAGELGPLGSALAAIGPAGLAVGAGLAVLTLGLKKSIEAAAEAEQIHNRLQAVLKATGNASGLTARQIVAAAEDIEKSTLATSEQVEQAATILATFRSVAGDSFTRTLKLAQDLAAAMGGDLQTRVLQLGKALDNPAEGLTALGRAGIFFTESQKTLIQSLVETGRQAEAQKVILDALEAKVGGAGAGEAKGVTGATNRLSDAWNNLLKEVGQTPAIVSATEKSLSGISLVFEKLRGLIKDDTFGDKVFKANKRLLEAQDQLQDLRETSAFSDNRLIGTQENRVAELQSELDRILAVAKQKAQVISAEQTQVDAGREKAASDQRAELLTEQRKKLNETLDRLMTEPAERIAKVNRELATTKERLASLREKDGSNNSTVDAALRQAETIARRQISAIEKPAQEAKKREAEAEAQKRLNALLNEGTQITKSTQTATEAYASELARLKELLVAGTINQETFNRAVEAAGKKQLDARTDAEAGAIRAFRTYREQAADTAGMIEKVFTNAMTATEDAIVGMVTSGSINLKSLSSLATSVLNDITRMMVRKSITEPLFNTLESGGFGKFLTGLLPFEQGGVMTAQGALPLHRYAMGGIASSPQLAMFGEGRRPEAYVPLPDGRTIPVTMQGGGTVNVIINNNSSAKVSAEERPNTTGGRDLFVQLDEMNAKLFGDPGSRSSRALTRSGGLASR
ncbi:MAG: phage tail tape measure C-terminal domain-containing protein [Pseudomonadota bacterium]